MKNISIIIPTFNEEPYIAKCLSAIIEGCKKYLGNTEIIVVDNQSSDNAIEIAKTYKVKVITSTRKTPAGVRNVGANIAQHEIYAFIDGDCIILENWLSMVGLAYDDLNVGAYGGEYLAPENDNWVVTSWNPIRLKKAYDKKAKLPGGNLTIRLSIFKRLKGFNAELTSAEDDYISMQVVNLGYYCILDNDAAVIHQGYPKTLREVYRKQVWHGSTQISAHGLFKDKVVLVTETWIFSWMLLMSALIYMQKIAILIAITGIVISPILITINRLKYHSQIMFSSFLPSSCVAIFFITDRAVGLIKEIANISSTYANSLLRKHM